MPFHFSIYSGFLISSAVISFLVALTIFSKYGKVGKYPAILVLLSGWWSATSAFCLIQSNISPMFTVVKLQYFSVAFFPAFWLLFVVNYLRKRVTLPLSAIIVLFAVPSLTFLLVLTNSWHHLYYTNIRIEVYEGLALFRFEKGPWYYVHSIYFYSCLLAGISLLIHRCDWKNYFFSRQTLVILLAVLVPAVFNLLYLYGVRPVHGVDLTPFAFTLTSLAICYSLFKYNLFDLLPVAREKVIEALQEGVLILDEKGRVVFLNRAMKEILGNDIVMEGRVIWSIYPKLHLINNNHQEVEIEEPTDLKRTYSVTSSDFTTDGLKQGRILLFKDITERKQNELSLRRAKEEAEQASKAKADFLSTMSHEIRTPMNAVIGFTNLLLPEAREDQKEYLNLLKYSGENLLILINDILDFSKIDAGKIELEKVDFDLPDLIKKVKQTLENRAIEKGIRLNTQIEKDVPTMIQGDPVRLGQIFTNLINNAVKFTEKGEVSINARLTASSDDFARICFDVSDTGIGIPLNKQESIFESFTQASSDTTRKFGGTGLGLAICKKLVELQGGLIDLKSEVGLGSSFQFELEFAKSKIHKLAENKAETSSINLQGLKVLLAEDNKINVVIARQFLKQWRVECDVAENGLQAVQMVQLKDYDLILMDLQMPEMDGYSATRAIRSLPGDKYQVLPVIALSAAALTEEKEKVYEYGMNDFVTKPFKPEDLFEKLSLYRPAEWVS